MAKRITVEIPRSCVPALLGDTEFAGKLHDAILLVENTGGITTIPVGKARKKATVSIEE